MDLLTGTALEALDWARATKVYHLEDALAWVDAGISDTALIDQYADLAHTLHGVKGLTPDNIATFAAVGTRVWTEDRDHAPEWAEVADLLDKYDDADEVFSALLDAGRGPAYARQVIAVARRHNEGLYDIDFRQDVAEIDDLLTGGVTPAELELWAAIGVDRPSAQRYTGQDLHLRTAQIGHGLGLDADQWLPVLGQYPLDWQEMVVGPQPWGTLADLRYLADAGWLKRRVDRPDRGTATSGTARAAVSAPLSAGQARAVADAGMVPDDVARWVADAVRRSRWPSRLQDETVEEHLTLWTWLHAHGVRPSHMAEYRLAGARTYEDVRAAVEAGIGPKRAKALRATYGRAEGYSSTRRIADLGRLLALHERDAAQAATVSA